MNLLYPEPLKNQHAVVTGAARGIGAAIAQQLAQAGAKLTLMGRHAAGLQDLAKSLQIGERVQVQTVDIADAASVEHAMAAAVQAMGPINLLINNAGQASSQTFLSTDLAAWQQMVTVNLTGTYLCIHAALPSMLQAAAAGTNGRIINVASTAGLKVYAFAAAYSAAKHGVMGLTRSLAIELARKGVTVNAVCPGYTETDIVKHAIDNIVHKTGKTPEQARSALASINPQQRLVLPEEVAHAVLSLCMSGSDAINGQAIVIDGGELAG